MALSDDETLLAVGYSDGEILIYGLPQDK